jgi:hypothetical protein
VLPDGSFHDGSGPCKYLIRDKDYKAVCTIHGKEFEHNISCSKFTVPWSETPCGRFSQIEQSNSPCRIGKNIKKFKWFKDGMKAFNKGKE